MEVNTRPSRLGTKGPNDLHLASLTGQRLLAKRGKLRRAKAATLVQYPAQKVVVSLQEEQANNPTYNSKHWPRALPRELT